jgi:lipopolysaccharide transport system ATP-binding protein
MSSDVVIKVENIGKCYQIYEKPSDRLKQFIFPKIQWLLGIKPKPYFKEFWALKDISFEVRKGESLGIIGRNGSGKSTLLQIICGLLEPSTGRVEVKGRVAALLELGSGFNPEFTGRENIYLNASLLGLTPDEINNSIESIILFADIGLHIDQPVKTYSSGMLVRLAFAVQAQVNPDILVVDEALAVGDAVFQHKCALRIAELQASGTILLFVSHESASVSAFCDLALLLHHGDNIALGQSKFVIETYLAQVKNEIYVASDKQGTFRAQAFLENKPALLSNSIQGVSLKNISARIGTGEAKIEHINLFNKEGDTSISSIMTGQPFRFRVRLKAASHIEHPVLCYRIDSLKGLQLTGSTSKHDDHYFPPMISGCECTVDIETVLPMGPGIYSLAIYLNNIPPGLPPITLDGLETASYIEISSQEGQNAPLYVIATECNWHLIKE